MLPRSGIILLLLILTLLLFAPDLIAGHDDNGSPYKKIPADGEPCFLCHKYLLLARFDDSGHKRVYYIKRELYKESFHFALKCSKCHSDAYMIPHKNVERVDCMMECHLKGWGALEDFSHKPAAKVVDESVHNRVTRRDGKPREYPGDVPDCIYCHENSSNKKEKEFIWSRMRNCYDCHLFNFKSKKSILNGEYTRLKIAYNRNNKNDHDAIVCISCHSDPESMNRHALHTINYFEDALHYKELFTGNKKAPDCIDCHAPPGFSVHDMRPVMDTASPVNNMNRENTCAQEYCHSSPISSESIDGSVHNIDVDIMTEPVSKWMCYVEEPPPGRMKGLFNKIINLFSNKEELEKEKRLALFEHYQKESEIYRIKRKRFHVVDERTEKVLGLNMLPRRIGCGNIDYDFLVRSNGFRVSIPFVTFVALSAVYFLVMFALIVYAAVYVISGLLYIKYTYFVPRSPDKSG